VFKTCVKVWRSFSPCPTVNGSLRRTRLIQYWTSPLHNTSPLHIELYWAHFFSHCKETPQTCYLVHTAPNIFSLRKNDSWMVSKCSRYSKKGPDQTCRFLDRFRITEQYVEGLHLFFCELFRYDPMYEKKSGTYCE
jgi:hypothetical protein